MKITNFLLIGLTFMAVTTAPQGYTYSGNNDFRGYLAANAPEYLSFTGNDGGINKTGMTNYYSGLGLQGDQLFSSTGNATNKVADLYNQFNSYQGAPLNNNLAVAPVGDANTAAYYDDTAKQLQGQLGQLDPQQQIGLQNIGNSYNQQANRLDENKAVAKRNYDTSVGQNDQSYSNNRNGIIQNTRANATALSRLLGINGAGNSSAAYEQAPYAAALQGSTQLNQAQQAYGNNQGALDTNWQDTQRGYSNAFDDLNNQKYQQENSLRSSIAQTKASLLDKIAQAGTQAGLARGQNYAQAAAARTPYQGQINDLLSQITQMSQQYANPVMRVSDVAYKAPTLANWNLNNQQAQAAAPQQQQGGANSDINPTFLGLLGQQQRDQYGNIIQA